MIELKIGSAVTEKGMGWLEWSASLVGSLAWPVAAVVIAILFRSQIKALLSKVRKLTWGDKSADFAEQLDKIEDTSREATPTAYANIGDQEVIVPDEKKQKLLELSPASFIVEVWKPIEKSIFDLAWQHKIDRRDTFLNRSEWNVEKHHFSLQQATNTLIEAGIITPSLSRTVLQLKKLRTEAAHSVADVTITDALRFLELANSVETELRMAAERKG